MKLSTKLENMRREAARLDAEGRPEEANAVTAEMYALTERFAQSQLGDTWAKGVQNFGQNVGNLLSVPLQGAAWGAGAIADGVKGLGNDLSLMRETGSDAWNMANQNASDINRMLHRQREQGVGGTGSPAGVGGSTGTANGAGPAAAAGASGSPYSVAGESQLALNTRMDSKNPVLVKRYVDWGRAQGMNKAQIYQHALEHNSQQFANQLARYMDNLGLK